MAVGLPAALPSLVSFLLVVAVVLRQFKLRLLEAVRRIIKKVASRRRPLDTLKQVGLTMACSGPTAGPRPTYMPAVAKKSKNEIATPAGPDPKLAAARKRRPKFETALAQFGPFLAYKAANIASVAGGRLVKGLWPHLAATCPAAKHTPILLPVDSVRKEQV